MVVLTEGDEAPPLSVDECQRSEISPTTQPTLDSKTDLLTYKDLWMKIHDNFFIVGFKLINQSCRFVFII